MSQETQSDSWIRASKHQVDQNETVAGTVGDNDVERPVVTNGIDITKAQPTHNDRNRTPYEKILGRSINVTYHVDSDSHPGGVLITFLKMTRTDSWEETDILGPATQKNDPTDIIATIKVTPLMDLPELPSADTYDVESDDDGETIEVNAATLLPNASLKKKSVDPDSIEQHEKVSEDANWFRLKTT